MGNPSMSTTPKPMKKLFGSSVTRLEIIKNCTSGFKFDIILLTIFGLLSDRRSSVRETNVKRQIMWISNEEICPSEDEYWEFFEKHS